jgi:hypothetical protein
VSESWKEINPEIHAGRVPWVRRVEESEICRWHIYADPFDDKADYDMILIGKPCPNRTRWRFDATPDSETPGGAYCYTHIRRIIDTPEEINRVHRLVEYRQRDETDRKSWHGTP